MQDDPVDLDTKRDRSAMIATEKRRKLLHEEDMNASMPTTEEEAPGLQQLGEQISSWVAAGSKARFLLLRYAQTREGKIPAQSRIIEEVMDELSDLIDEAIHKRP